MTEPTVTLTRVPLSEEQWRSTLLLIADRIREQPALKPLLVRCEHNDLIVVNTTSSGRLYLRKSDPRGLTMSPIFNVASGVALVGELSRVRQGIREYTAVCDALEFAVACLGLGELVVVAER